MRMTKRLSLLAFLLLLGAGCAGTPESEPVGAPTYYPDEGVRMEDASNPGARLNDDGTLDLLFEDTSARRHVVATSEATSDWLDFVVTDTNADVGVFRALKLPDGTCRAFGTDATKGIDGTGMTSRSSKDCVTYTEDEGYRYVLQPEDNGRMGVWDLFVDSDGGIVLLYLGDMLGLNNVRRAYSTDGGWTFEFTNGNVFGDDDAGGGARSFVDDKVLVLPDGTVRAITMRGGSVHTFLSTDDGKTFAYEDEVLSPEDFSDGEYVGLFDPQLVLLPDGRQRIYVTAQAETGNTLPDGRRELASVIVSATTR